MKQNLASLAVSAASGLVGGSVIVAAGFVNLQDATPGTAQTGHINIDGTGRFGSVGVGTAPANARVQVNETGTLQGVRAATNSGIGVFGTSTSNNGGLFVTKGNSNAVVGDAQSTTGITAGGVFYNRSSNGVGVWGRQIKADGTGIGVRGSTASATGSAAFFQNENTSSSARIAGPDGSLLTNGPLPKHQYTPTTSAEMVPIAWGVVLGSGATFGVGSNNWTATRTAAGQYTITVTDFTLANTARAIIAIPIQESGDESASSGDSTQGVRIYSHAANSLVDSAFRFVLFGTPVPVSASPVEDEPAELKRWGIEGWQSRDPRGFEAWRKQSVARQREAMRVAPEVNFDVPRP